MKVVTIIGTRPEIIKMSEIIRKLDKYTDHVLVHTGQNYDPELNEIIFKGLDVREPDYRFTSKADTTIQLICNILPQVEQMLIKEKPDAVLILGDTYSGLSAFVVKRLGIPMFHIEAGNRAYSDDVPEEVNRRIIDTCSDILMPHTQRAREQLLVEGYHPKKIFVIGDPIAEIIRKYKDKANESNILQELGVEGQEYVVATIHRTEHVENPEILSEICDSLLEISNKYKVIVSVHPHMKKYLDENVKSNENIKFLKPFAFLDFLKLEMNAICMISDSGTVQQESAILGKPSLFVRTVTERPEMVDAGKVIVSGVKKQDILDCFNIAINLTDSEHINIPDDYKDDVSDKVLKILMRYRHV